MLQWCKLNNIEQYRYIDTFVHTSKLHVCNCFVIYYQVTTFRQFNTLWFVSLDTMGFCAWNYSGSFLNYLIHQSWFLFGGNRNNPCHFRKQYHLLIKCHRISQLGSMPNSISDEWSDECHRVSRWLLSWNHLLTPDHILTNWYYGFNPSLNAFILFLDFFLHVLDSVSDFIINLAWM